jgi:nitroreductase
MEAGPLSGVSVTDAVMSRHSCRAFLDRPIDPMIVRRMLDTARFAPSGGNLQPWIVHVLTGASLAEFRAALAPKVAERPLGSGSEYDIYPPHLKEPYRTRRFKVGEDLYSLIGVKRDDRPGRIRQFARNYDFFGAPAAMLFFVDRTLGPPQWSDVGMFLQNLMLLAREQGLASCAQEAWSAWHTEVSQLLKIGPELMLFCGMALGYGDDAAPINQLRADRAALDDFAVWHS